MIKYFTQVGVLVIFKPVMEQLKSEGHPIQILDVDPNQQHNNMEFVLYQLV